MRTVPQGAAARHSLHGQVVSTLEDSAGPSVPTLGLFPADPATRAATGESPLVIGERRAVVGRSSKCDISPLNRQVSREHARLDATGQGWGIEDLASTGGTFLDGHRVSVGVRVPIHSGMLVELGGSSPDGPAAFLIG